MFFVHAACIVRSVLLKIESQLSALLASCSFCDTGLQYPLPMLFCVRMFEEEIQQCMMAQYVLQTRCSQTVPMSCPYLCACTKNLTYLQIKFI